MFEAFDFCLPTRGIKVPDRPEWVHEVKYDGYRLRVERDGDRVRLTVSNRNRSGRNYELVCGQGRIEAFSALSAKEIPAIVVDATTAAAVGGPSVRLTAVQSSAGDRICWPRRCLNWVSNNPSAVSSTEQR